MTRPRRHDPFLERTRSGMTLVEMLIAVVIVGILASVALVSSGTSSAQTLESVGQVLLSDLRLSRSWAIEFGSSWKVDIDATQDRYQLVYAGPLPVPPVQRPFSDAAQSASPGYITVDLSDTTRASPTQVALLGATVGDLDVVVTDLTFEPDGGTGPIRTQDTKIYLGQWSEAGWRYLRLTISWVTGQIWVDYPATVPSAIAP